MSKENGSKTLVRRLPKKLGVRDMFEDNRSDRNRKKVDCTSEYIKRSYRELLNNLMMRVKFSECLFIDMERWFWCLGIGRVELEINQ